MDEARRDSWQSGWRQKPPQRRRTPGPDGRKWLSGGRKWLALGIRWTKDLTETVSAHVMGGLVRRGLATPATNEMAHRPREGLHETWSALGGQVDADSSRWWTFPEERGITNEAPRQWWEAVVTRLQDWVIFNPKDLSETRCGFTIDVPEDDERKQLTLKLRLAATAKSTAAPDRSSRAALLSWRTR